MCIQGSSFLGGSSGYPSSFKVYVIILAPPPSLSDLLRKATWQVARYCFFSDGSITFVDQLS